jgi:hypothetical protein
MTRELYGKYCGRSALLSKLAHPAARFLEKVEK